MHEVKLSVSPDCFSITEDQVLKYTEFHWLLISFRLPRYLLLEEHGSIYLEVIVYRVCMSV